MKELLEQLSKIDKRTLKESIDPQDLHDLVSQYENGDINYKELRKMIDELENDQYDFDSFDDEDMDYIDKNAQEDDEVPYRYGEEDDFYSPDEYRESYSNKCESCPSLNEECDMTECGGDMSSMPPEPRKQDDSVSMTVNMSGSGSGGIRDILNILRNIESQSSDDAKPYPNRSQDDRARDTDIGMILATKSEPEFEKFQNAPDEKYSSLKDLTRSGNDLHRAKDSYSDKPYRGDNPMAVKEKLESLYQFVKSK